MGQCHGPWYGNRRCLKDEKRRSRGLVCGCLSGWDVPESPHPIPEFHVQISKILLAAGLLFGATSAAALSLGEARASVVLGRPLDVLFDVHPDPGTTLDPACLSASATLGDTRIDSSRMQISLLPAAGGRAPGVRVRSRVLVDEPILSVQLSAGCTTAVSRTYHLLADPPATLAAAVFPVLPGERRSTGDSGAATDAARGVELPATTAGRVQSAAPRVAAAPRASRAPVAKKGNASPSRRAAKSAEPAIPASTSRLVLQPLEDDLRLPATLRLSSDLQALPSQDPSPERAQAAAHWKALHMPLDDSAEQPERTLALSAQAAAARAAAAQAQSAVSALQERVDRLESERFSPSLVYALLALLVATLAGWGGYALRTRRRTAGAPADWSDAVAVSTLQATEREGAPRSERRARGNAGLLDKHLDLFLQGDGPVQPEAPAIVVPHAATPIAPLAHAASAVPAVHVLQPEDLFDLQQQAEFFISVGEHDQAIDVMSRHIDENHAASPWAYVELLRLYRSLSRVGPFNQLRAQFLQHFNAQVPEFAAFHHLNRRLLDYPEVLACIEALWSDDAVLPLLEGLLFRREATPSMERFDLSAYDDLLMLYAIARTTAASARGAPPPRQRTTPLAAAGRAASPAPAARLDLENLDSATLAPLAPTSPAVDNMIEYDMLAPQSARPAAVVPDGGIDIDLAEPDWKDSQRLPVLTVSDLPAVPVTAAPARGQPVGFGAHSDRVEARFDLEERKPDAL